MVDSNMSHETIRRFEAIEARLDKLEGSGQESEDKEDEEDEEV